MMLLAILPAVGMQILYVSAVNVALPTMTADLGLSPGVAQLIVVIYPISLAALLIPAGRWGDTHTPKRMYQLGLVLFLLGSAMAGAATGIGMLLAGRALQGVAAGTLLPQVLSMIQHEFAGLERARAMGRYSVAIATAILVGPVFGGALIQLDLFGLGWRTMFLAAVPVAAILLLLSVAKVPIYERLPADRGNLIAVLLLIVGVGSLSATITLMRDLSKIGVMLLGAASALVIGLFFLVERRTHASGGAPLIRRTLLRQPLLRLGLLMNVCFALALVTVTITITFYLQFGLGFSALAAGIAVFWSSVGELPGGLVVARLIGRLAERTLLLGACAMLIGYVLIVVGSMFVFHLGVFAFAPSLVAWGFGLGLLTPSTFMYATRHVTNEEIGGASGLLNMSQQFSGSIGLAISSAIFFGVWGRSAPTSGTGAAVPTRLTVVELINEPYWSALTATVVYQTAATVIGLALVLRMMVRIRQDQAPKSAEG